MTLVFSYTTQVSSSIDIVAERVQRESFSKNVSEENVSEAGKAVDVVHKHANLLCKLDVVYYS